MSLLILTSPAKTLNWKDPYPDDYPTTTLPLLAQTQPVIEFLKSQSPQALTSVLGVSKTIAEENYQRYQNYHQEHTLKNSRPALYAYAGDIFKQLTIPTYNKAQRLYAARTVWILSGFYGVVRSSDLIQPYRLEMKTKLPQVAPHGMDVYWQEHVTKCLEQEIQRSKITTVVNLASQEYAAAVNPDKLSVPYLTIDFKDLKQGTYQIVGFNAKRARGKMIDLAIHEQAQTPEALKKFTQYQFNSELSTSANWVFTKDA